MSLPNFVNFQPFNNLRRKMHRSQLGQFDLERYRARHYLVGKKYSATESGAVEEKAAGGEIRNGVQAASEVQVNESPKTVTRAKPSVRSTSSRPKKAASTAKPAAKSASSTKPKAAARSKLGNTTKPATGQKTTIASKKSS